MQQSSQRRRVRLSAPAAQAIRPARAVATSAIPWGILVELLCVAGLLFASSSAHGQAIDREYKLKAAYLYKFATYVAWPEQAFQAADSPFVIGVLGPDPVGAHLRKIAEVKMIAGRRIEVRNYQEPEEIGECHILFLPRDLADEKQQRALKLLSGRNILFVGEDASFLEHGGVVDFVVQENRIRIRISQPAYEREELEVSAQLLRIAAVIK